MDKTQLSDVVTNCKRGDKQAFKQLMHEYLNYIFSLAFRILGNEDDAKDIVQETFIRLWKNIARYNENIKITTWMYKICTNLCFDVLKSRKRKPILYQYEWENSYKHLVEDNVNDTIDNQQLAEIVAYMSEELTPKQKIVFVLRDIQDLSTEEVVEITGLNKGQIKSNLFCARQEIRNKLIKLGYEMC